MQNFSNQFANYWFVIYDQAAPLHGTLRILAIAHCFLRVQRPLATGLRISPDRNGEVVTDVCLAQPVGATCLKAPYPFLTARFHSSRTVRQHPICPAAYRPVRRAPRDPCTAIRWPVYRGFPRAFSEGS